MHDHLFSWAVELPRPLTSSCQNARWMRRWEQPSGATTWHHWPVHRVLPVNEEVWQEQGGGQRGSGGWHVSGWKGVRLSRLTGWLIQQHLRSARSHRSCRKAPRATARPTWGTGGNYLRWTRRLGALVHTKSIFFVRLFFAIFFRGESKIGGGNYTSYH